MTQFFPTLIPYRSGEKWGFSDREKNIKIDLNYDQTYPFVGDIARVTKNGLSGLIDRNGNEILPAAYEEVGSIITGTFMNDNGTCTIYHQGTYGLVSVHGKILADVTFSSETDAFSYAVNKGWKGAVASSQHPEMPGGVIRKLEAIKPYQDGIAPFKRQGCWGLISRQGKVVCDERYDDIEAAENGDWPFKKSEKWGLLDSSGQEIIPPEFNQIRGFSNGQAACKNGKLWGAIDRSG
ncbi:MAG: WG repeat-containing protein, partial [Bacteroidota bacterium]